MPANRLVRISRYFNNGLGKVQGIWSSSQFRNISNWNRRANYMHPSSKKSSSCVTIKKAGTIVAVLPSTNLVSGLFTWLLRRAYPVFPLLPTDARKKQPQISLSGTGRYLEREKGKYSDPCGTSPHCCQFVLRTMSRSIFYLLLYHIVACAGKKYLSLPRSFQVKSGVQSWSLTGMHRKQIEEHTKASLPRPDNRPAYY